MTLFKKQLSPDAPPPGGGDTPDKSGKSSLPNADDDFLAAAEKVSETWTATPAITLLWTTSGGFATLVGNFKTVLGDRKSTGSNRPNQTQSLEEIISKIDTGAAKVKTYIDEKWDTKASARAQYARYGFVHNTKSGYRLPKDRDKLLTSLPLMIAAIAADGFGSKTYGTTFWTDITTEFTNALKAANITDGTVSSQVGDKNELKKQIRKVFVALRFVLRGNYPDTYKSVYRSWGWQKEDY